MKAEESEEFNDIKCKFGVLSRPNTSVFLCQGETAVVAGIYGPVEARTQKLLIEKASIEVYYRPKMGFPGIGDRLIESIIRNTCETALLSALYPRTSVLIVIQEMQNSGGLLSCAINASCLALLDSGIDMKFLVASTSCAIDNEDILHIDPGTLIMDNAKATFDFVFDSVEQNIIASHTTGSFTVQQYEAALTRCKEASVRIFKFYKQTVAKKLNYK